MQYRVTSGLQNNTSFQNRYVADKVHTNFFYDLLFSNYETLIETFDYNYLSSSIYSGYAQYPQNGYYNAQICQGKSINHSLWQRVTFFKFLSSFGALVMTIFSIMAFLVRGYENFIKDKSMLKMLYGEHYSEKEKQVRRASKQIVSGDLLDKDIQDNDTAKQIFQEHIEARKDFRFGYWTFLLISSFLTCCCCISPCCQRRFSWWRKRVHSFKKFKIAKMRLWEEEDVQKMLALNRVTRVMHKLMFKPRQRRTVSYFRRYVLTD